MTQKSLEERITAIEVSVKYLGDQIREMRTDIQNLTKELIERKELNGHQDISIAKLQERVSTAEAKLAKAEEVISDLSVRFWKFYGGALVLIGVVQALIAIFFK